MINDYKWYYISQYNINNGNPDKSNCHYILATENFYNNPFINNFLTIAKVKYKDVSKEYIWVTSSGDCGVESTKDLAMQKAEKSIKDLGKWFLPIG